MTTLPTNPDPWILFLDDERFPTYELYDAIVARSVEDAKGFIGDFGLPTVISFDHDLGDNVPSGYDLLKWLVDQHLDELLDLNHIKRVIVHSANPVGAQNIENLWNGFADNFLGGHVRAEIKSRALHK